MEDLNASKSRKDSFYNSRVVSQVATEHLPFVPNKLWKMITHYSIARLVVERAQWQRGIANVSAGQSSLCAGLRH